MSGDPCSRRFAVRSRYACQNESIGRISVYERRRSSSTTAPVGHNELRQVDLRYGPLHHRRGCTGLFCVGQKVVAVRRRSLPRAEEVALLDRAAVIRNAVNLGFALRALYEQTIVV